MIHSLLDLLACPYDNHYPLTLEVKELKGEMVIETGDLICPECQHHFPIQHGIPNIMPDELVKGKGDREIDDRLKEMEERDIDSSGYDLRYTSLKYKAKYKTLLDELNPEQEDIILDLGAGTGVLTASYINKCKCVVAVDFSFQSLMKLKGKVKRDSVHLIHADASFLPLRKGIFDKVVSNDLLEHIPSDKLRRAVIKQIYDMLRKGGELTLSAYHLNFSKKIKGLLKIGDVRGREGYHSDGKIYYYNFTRKEMEKLLGELFEVIDVKGLQHELPVIHLIMGEVFPYFDYLIAMFPFSNIFASEILLHCVKR
ncbi:MAG: methyltransferase domain-containing protein [Nitrospinae bacterium]|nr:methyltransferase domain-containing protein [Nitrospinota bacterium]